MMPLYRPCAPSCAVVSLSVACCTNVALLRGGCKNYTLKYRLPPPLRFVHEVAAVKDVSAADMIEKEKTAKRIITFSATKHSQEANQFPFKITKERQRLSKLLAAHGVASRRKSEDLVFAGQVTVNGFVCTIPQTQVNLSKDVICVNGHCLPKKNPKKWYFALNKPKGYICSSGVEFKSVISLFDEFWREWHHETSMPRLFAVGRLDVATTGLIIVTNDGHFAQRLAHPSYGVVKELSEANCRYIACIDGRVCRKHLRIISEGTEVNGIKCMPEFVELVPMQPDMRKPRLRIVVTEGRSHEVRELVRNAGLQLHSLKRTRIGGFKLPRDLSHGKYIVLKKADLKLLDQKVLTGNGAH